MVADGRALFCFCESTKHVETILGLPLGQRDSENARQRCQYVGQADHLIAHSACRNWSRPADKERFAEATFPLVVLAAPERPVDLEARLLSKGMFWGRGYDSAVVAGKYDQS